MPYCPAACRDPARAKIAVSDILSTVPDGKVRTVELDLASFQSIRAFVLSLEKSISRLDILINNAAVMNTAFSLTEDGYELQYALPLALCRPKFANNCNFLTKRFGTNHLGHFLLTQLLLPLLKKSAPSRVVNVSSYAHEMWPGAIDTIYKDVNMEKAGYSGWNAYGRSKLCNILFTFALNRKYQEQGVTAYTLHPGSIPTELGRHTCGSAFIRWIASWIMKTIPQGASTTVYCATHPHAIGGRYYTDCHVEAPYIRAGDIKLQEDLWDLSLQMTGLKSS